MKGRCLLVSLALAVLTSALFCTMIAADQKLEFEGRERSTGPPKTVPGQLNYQGYLAETADTATVNATLEMTFRLFDSETKGAELWSETHTMVTVSQGLFQVLLGSVTSFPAGLFDGSPLWLQTEVGTEVLVPRKPLVSAAYAQMTETANHAATADWATDAQNAVRADTADHCAGASAWTISGDDVYRETGKVGIGTTSPLTELDVAGSVNATTYYGDGSNLTGISAVPDSDWVISGNDIYSAVSGKVGIGVAHPTTELDVNGVISATTYYGDGSNLTGISGTTDNDWTIDGNNIYHEIGDVAIGTTTPELNLHIYDDVNNIVGIKLENISTEWSSREGIIFADENGSVAGIVTYDDSSTPPNAMRIYNNRTGGAMTFWTGSVERVRLTADGKFGIGTSSPSQALDVSGAVNATTYYGDGSNLTGISGTTDNDWTIDGDDVYHEIGNVGIGTTSPAVEFQVVGSARIGTGSAWLDIGNDGWLFDANAAVTVDDELRVLSSADSYFNGSLGIGTSSPAEKLDVHGTIQATAPDGPHYIIHDSNGSNDRPGIQFTNNSIHYIGGDDGSDEYFGFYSLYNSTRTYDAHLRVHGKATSNWGKYIDLTHDGSDGIISTDAGDIVLDPAANVGIGTSSPAEKLVIQGTGPKLALNTTNTSANALYFQESGATKWSIAYAPGSDYLYFYDFTKGGTRMVLQDGTGYIGIGTGSPAAPLDVNGTAKADTVKVDHDLVVTGAYKGSIGPNNGAPFPRPAYDSGWQSISAGVPLIFNHSIGGDTDDYVVEMSVNGGTSNEHLFTGAVYWNTLNSTSVAAHRRVGDTTISTVRMRIWMYN
jgi:hypothetical protein